ncbi:MAG: alpha-D-ribose 1-methylphosphonate 5-triphosphate diphosphatase [Gordonibacter pamelaeae]
MNDNSCIIRGGTVVCADRVLPDHDVVVIDGRIAAIEPAGAREFDAQPDATVGVLPVVDARGAFVAPGLIDIHSDYVENVASPRPSVVMDLNTSLYKADRELVSHGITTIFHSLSVYGAHIFDHKPIRDFGNVSGLIDRVAGLRAGEERDHLIRHRLHMRVELDSVDLYDDIEEFLRSGKVDLVSFMDHTPGQGQYRDLLLFGDTLKGYRDVTDEEVRDIVRMQQESSKMTYAQIAALASIARERGISIASHDDDSAEKLAFMDGLEASISEFPISLDVAREARARGLHTVAGAPNVMLGHSHSGNLSAREAVEAGAIDVLCSDYYPAALLDAVFTLRDECGLDIARAFALVSVNPAKAAGIADEVGSLAVESAPTCCSCARSPAARRARARCPWSRARSWAGIPCSVRTTPTSPSATPATWASGSTPPEPTPPALSFPRRCSMALLEIDDLSKSFLLHRVDRRIQGCQHVSFALEPGQFVGITGRSGSGKSTILRCIWRTNLPEQGRILYDSARFGLLDLAQATQRQMLYLRAYELGYVSQFLNALPRQTARDIVLKSALEAYGADERARAEAETERMLRHFDLDEGLWELYPRTFSGGEKLRLNIAAAMIKRPRLLLLDEPTASLDNASKLKVRTLIEQLKAEGTTMLGIFHDLEFMEGLCDHEFNMQEGMMA